MCFNAPVSIFIGVVGMVAVYVLQAKGENYYAAVFAPVCAMQFVEAIVHLQVLKPLHSTKLIWVLILLIQPLVISWARLYAWNECSETETRIIQILLAIHLVAAVEFVSSNDFVPTEKQCAKWFCKLHWGGRKGGVYVPYITYWCLLLMCLNVHDNRMPVNLASGFTLLAALCKILLNLAMFETELNWWGSLWCLQCALTAPFIAWYIR